MDTNDDRWKRAGAALRARADDLSRSGAGPERVTRILRRRRALQGTLAVAAVVAVTVAGLSLVSPTDPPGPTIDPVGPPPSAQPDEPPAEEDSSTASADVTGATICDPQDEAVPATASATVGTQGPSAPAAVTGSPLVPVGDEVYALRHEGGAGFASLGSGSWRCLASPELTGPRLAIGGHPELLLAVSSFGAAVFDPTTERWTDSDMPDLEGARPVGGVWAGDEFVVVVEARERGEDSRVLAYDPAVDDWSQYPSPPFPVNRQYHTSVLWDGDRVLLFGNWLDGMNRASSDTAMLAAFDPAAEAWEHLPDSPLSPQAAQAVVVDGRVLTVDYAQQFAEFDLDGGQWSEPAPTGISPSECSPQLTVGDDHLLVSACWSGAVVDLDLQDWAAFETGGPLVGPTSLGDDRVALWWSAEDGSDEHLRILDLPSLASDATSADVCADIGAFADALADTGMARDETDGTASPEELAADVDLAAAGWLTGGRVDGDGPGPAGESYVGYELVLTEVFVGDAQPGDTMVVSVAYDGSSVRAEALQDVPIGTEVVIFAHEVTNAPGELVAVAGEGLAVACPDGPPLGQLGDGWDEVTSLDDLVETVRDATG